MSDRQNQDSKLRFSDFEIHTLSTCLLRTRAPAERVIVTSHIVDDQTRQIQFVGLGEVGRDGNVLFPHF